MFLMTTVVVMMRWLTSYIYIYIHTCFETSKKGTVNGKGGAGNMTW